MFHKSRNQARQMSLIGIVLICLVHSLNGFIHVDPTTSLFVDDSGSTRIFHGLAADFNFQEPNMTEESMQVISLKIEV